MTEFTISIELLTSLIMACTGGFIVITYQDFAKWQMWEVGKLFQNNNFMLFFGVLPILVFSNAK